LKIIPQKRKNETLAFINQGLEDFSISRTVARAHGWGIPVPNDPSQIIYVWYDALTIYMTGIGWGWDEKTWQKWWPADIHLIGKGINRFHTLYWPAMLLSAKLPLPKQVLIHGYITSEGQKMSKSLGNVIDPIELVKKYGADAVRYYLLKEIPTTDDGDFSETRFKELYNADLANGLGNLVQRTATLCQKANLGKKDLYKKFGFIKDVEIFVEKYQFHQALNLIQEYISGLDKYISRQKPWTKPPQKLKEILKQLVIGTEAGSSIFEIAQALKIFIPQTAERIEKIFTADKIRAPKKPLFPRLE